MKEQRKILDNWAANLKRDEVGGKEIEIKDLIELDKRLDEISQDAHVEVDE